MHGIYWSSTRVAKTTGASLTVNSQGCQIDYLVQTITKNLFVCEFKFKRRELAREVIQDMQEKISALKIPRGYAAVPVLFHIGGVAASVETAGYFYRIIDIADFLAHEELTIPLAVQDSKF